MRTNITDGLTSLASGLGSDRSKLHTLHYTAPTADLTNYRNAYRSSALARRIVDQFAEDAFRKWRAWQVKDQSILTRIEAEEKRLNVRSILERALKQARLDSKCYVYISVKGDEGRADTPLNPERVKQGGITMLNMLTQSEVSEGEIDYDALSPTYGEPKYYEVMSVERFVRIHPSRMVIFYGNERPYDFSAGRCADSVLMSLLPAISRHEAMADIIGDLMFEACVDVVTVPGLQEMVQDPEQEAAILARFALAKQMKANNRITILSGSVSENLNSEEWQQKQISFATLPDVLEADQYELCAQAEYPHALLFEKSAGGMGSTGDLELSNYYDRVNTVQTNVIEPSINLLDECILRSALGNRPEDIWYQWNSLWQVSDKEKSEIGDRIAGKWQKLVQSGVFPADAVTNAVINDLTEAGVGGGIDQTYEEWLSEGGIVDPVEEEDMNGPEPS